MLKKIAAVAGGVFIGLIIAFARVGAFPFWGGDDQSKTQPAQTAQGSKSPQSAAQAEMPPPPLPAPPVAGSTTTNEPKPEPNEKVGVITSFAPLVKRVMPTVVNVAVVQDVKVSGSPFGMGPNGPDGGDDGGGDDNGPGGGGGPGASGPPGMPPGGDPFDQLRRYFGQGPHEQKQHGLGSGVIVSADGYILTNNHVVGNAEDIHVTLMDKREFTAKVIGKDPKTDLALIKIDTKDSLPAAALGESNDALVGDWVIAIGNPFGFSLTVTSGIVSAKGRNIGAGDYDDFIQTDASINPGNSGGPLFNTDGQVIGINTAIYSRTGSSNGIGFAIPVDMAKNVMDQLKAHGRVVRGWLGVEIQEVTADLAQSFGLAKPEGALIASTDKDGPAAKAGLERGDIVTTYDGKTVHDEHELPALVAQTPINKKVTVEVVRNGKHMNLDVTIGERKEPQVASAKAEEPGGNWGMQVGEITPEIAQQLHIEASKGIVIRRVSPDSPASDAGLLPGDVVLEVNHDKVSTVDEFVNKAKEAKTTKKAALLLVQRGGATLYTVIKPETGKG
jgi:serine protease Do